MPQDSTEKTCAKCGEVKPLEEFHRNRGGRHSRCRTCTSAYFKAYYQANREKVLSTNRRWNSENRERLAEMERRRLAGSPEARARKKEQNQRWAEANRERVRQRARRHYRRHRLDILAKAKANYDPVKARAWGAVRAALKRGDLISQPCVKCGSDRSEAHHHKGYEPEHWLDVEWLCRPCHTLEHRREENRP